MIGGDIDGELYHDFISSVRTRLLDPAVARWPAPIPPTCRSFEGCRNSWPSEPPGPPKYPKTLFPKGKIWRISNLQVTAFALEFGKNVILLTWFLANFLEVVKLRTGLVIVSDANQSAQWTSLLRQVLGMFGLSASRLGVRGCCSNLWPFQLGVIWPWSWATDSPVIWPCFLQIQGPHWKSTENIGTKHCQKSRQVSQYATNTYKYCMVMILRER